MGNHTRPPVLSQEKIICQLAGIKWLINSITRNKLEAALRADLLPEGKNPDHPACLAEAFAMASESCPKKGVQI